MGTPSNEDLLEVLDLVRSWQHPDQVHLRGCPATTYYIAACSARCAKARAMVTITPEQIARLPISGSEFGRSSLEAY